MQLFYVFWNLATFLIYPSIITTAFLYLYPALFNCDFPAPTRVEQEECKFKKDEFRNVTVAEVAPFRLLVFADPQLEGDSSLPRSEDPTFPNLYRIWTGNFSTDDNLPFAVTKALGGFVIEDVPQLLWSYKKRVDLFGNDFYLAHIYRAVNWWARPTHVTVLGDLLGSQWVSDAEFERRGRRFWNRVFRKARRVEDDITAGPHQPETLGQDPSWRRRLINIAGNHDIGYAGDLDEHRMERFERVFGKANWVKTFILPENETMSTSTTTSSFSNPFAKPPLPREIRLLVLNTMNLDGPVLEPSLQSSTYNFINDEIIIPSRPPDTPTTLTILLTHVPLHKEAGICADSPYLAYNDSGAISEQYHLTPSSSHNILEGIFGMSADPSAPAGGMGRHGVILNGHDHTGCDTYHYLDRGTTTSANEFATNASEASPSWAATPWSLADQFANDPALPGIREITVRSMMGSYQGNAGMLSAWFDETAGEWKFAYASCSFGVQHFWWGVHALVLVTLSCFVLAFLSLVWGDVAAWREEKRKRVRMGKSGKEMHVKSE